MKVYLASRYSTKDIIKGCAKELRDIGIEVTSSWLEEPHGPEVQLTQISGEESTQYAYRDLVDISSADILVFFSVDPTIATIRGGRHVEYGYALGIRKPILVVGPKENIFHSLSEVKHVDTWLEALHFLKRKHLSRRY